VAFLMSGTEIKNGVINGKIKLAIIGLGQVGLPLALHFAKAGASVTGADIDKRKIRLIKQGVCPINIDSVTELFNQVHDKDNLHVTSEISEAVTDSQVHILCVSIPPGNNDLPDITALVAGADTVGKNLKKGNLIILESSVYSGFTTKLVKPTLEKSSGLRAGEDFGLAQCFEHANHGNTIHAINNTTKAIGAIDERSAAAASGIYSAIGTAPVIKMQNCETDEPVNLVENAYQNVNIAFANEVALFCHKLGVDALEMLEAAPTKWSFVPYIPSGGVGDTCIPVNPHHLTKRVTDKGLDLKSVQPKRTTNASMPHHMVELIMEAVAKIKKPIGQTRICILGLAYAEIDDSRGAPGEVIANELKQLGATVICHDPVVTSAAQGLNFEGSFEKAIKDSDCIVITTEHTFFKSLNLPHIVELSNTPLAIVDGKHMVVPKEATGLGIIYLGLGQTKDSERGIWNVKLKR